MNNNNFLVYAYKYYWEESHLLTKVTHLAPFHSGITLLFKKSFCCFYYFKLFVCFDFQMAQKRQNLSAYF